MKSTEYTQVSQEYLAAAEEALRQKDYLQASEKLWGAAAQRVKAIAEAKGWPHDGHAALFQVVRRLVRETGDRELDSLFRIANQLHMNFYENWLPPESVEQAAGEVKRLLAKLERIV